MYEPQRTIKEVIDFETGEIIHADDFFVQTEDVIFTVRRRLEEGIQGIRTPKFGCLFCKQLIKISGRLLERGEVVKFFSHLKDSDDCAIKTTTNLSKEEIEAIKYVGFKESERHRKLKEFIAGALVSNKINNRGITEIKIEKTVRDEVFSFEWRRPDVASIYRDKKIVFELQLSTTFLSVVVGRDDFYRNNNTYIIWVFNFMSMDADWQKFMEKDIYYANKRNAFVLDTEAQNQSSERGELVLHCFWQVPMVSDDKVEITWEDKFIILSELTYCPDTYKVYYIDGDLLFDEVEPEKREFILKWESEKRERHLRLVEKSRRLYEERLIRQKERELLRLSEERQREVVRIDLLNKVSDGSVRLVTTQKGNKWGFATSQGEIVIPYEYDFVGDFKEGLAKFRKNRRYGYINLKNEVVIPNEYIELSDFYFSHAAARKEKKWYLVNDNNEIVTQLDFYDVDIVGENLLKVTRKTTERDHGSINTSVYSIYHANYSYFTGVFDFQGNEVLPFQYGDIRKIVDNKILAQKNGYWGYVNFDNSIIIPFEFSEIEPFLDGKAKAKKNGYWGFIDEKGSDIVPFKYNKINTFSAGRAKAQKGNCFWGIIDENGCEIVPFKYLEIDRYTKGIARVKDENGQYGYIDEFGSIIISFNYSQLENFVSGKAKGKKNNLWGYIDDNEKDIVPFEYEAIEPFDKGKAKARKNGLWGYIDENGKDIVAFEYESIEPFDEGKAKARKNGLWGYIDENGKHIVPFEYESIEPFDEGKAKAQKKRLWGYIDENGRNIVPFEYESIEYFIKGVFDIQTDKFLGYRDINTIELTLFKGKYRYEPLKKFLITQKNGYYGCIDANGVTLIDNKYDSIKYYSENRIKVKQLDLWGLLHLHDGSEILPIIFQEIDSLSKGFFKVKQNEKWGCITEDKIMLVDINYESIIYYFKNRIKVKQSNLWGLLHLHDGSEILPIIFQEIDAISKGFIKIKRNEKWGYSTEDGKPAIKCVYDELGNFLDDEIIIKDKECTQKIKYLAKYIYNEKRGYVDMKGKEYWQYWKDERDKKPKPNIHFHKYKKKRW